MASPIATPVAATHSQGGRRSDTGPVGASRRTVDSRNPRGEERRRATYARGSCRPASDRLRGIEPRTGRTSPGGERRRGMESIAISAGSGVVSGMREARGAGGASD